ncbi:hypothetical protein GCM10009864_54310 [Streptomyces lunalinharesii]|uniref:Transposase n=1 Tax=Streptomyces lunalinharesii TaxID=333384 RepID=A0ABP6ETW9_9ACTN
MLRRLCTARETKLQLGLSLARCAPEVEEPKITFGSEQEWQHRAPASGTGTDGSSLRMWTIQPSETHPRAPTQTTVAAGREWATSSS